MLIAETELTGITKQRQKWCFLIFAEVIFPRVQAIFFNESLSIILLLVFSLYFQF